MKDVLPDCRSYEGRGAVSGPQGMWVPIYCGNCHKEGGKVLEVNLNFIFWLCDDCAKTCGQIAGTMMVPDEEFWANVRAEQRQEQLEKKARFGV